MDSYLGEIRIFPYSFVPKDWAYCDGTQLPIAKFSALYAVIGTTYGGDGKTNFALPDLRDRLVIGGGGRRPIGSVEGVDSVTLTGNQIPTHTHLMDGVQLPVTQRTDSAPGKYLSMLAKVSNTGTEAASLYTTARPERVTQLHPQTLSPAGASQAHDNKQPVLGIGYFISLEGEFPPKQ